MPKLDETKCKILACLDDVAFIGTRDVARVVFPNSAPRSASGAARGNLKQLQARNLVELGDDKFPLIWRRTPAGRRALKDREA